MTSRSETFPIGACPSCGGKRIWIDRSFNPWPRWSYVHNKGCPAGKHYSPQDQDRDAVRSGVCPVHGLEPEFECRTCIAIADADYWGDQE